MNKGKHTTNNRQCSPCTACCQGWLPAEINGVKIKPGTPCKHAGEQGCGIYSQRPRFPCETFSCGWLQRSDVFPEHMKPSLCGAIVLLGRRWHGRKIIRAVPTGEKIPPKTLEWLMAYSRKQTLPLLFSEHIFENGRYIGKKFIGYGPQDFIHAAQTEVGPEDIMR